MKHELDLLENSLDSLNEALLKFQAGEEGNQRAYKFAVLNLAHALELLFKYYVTQAHPLLIYKNPFSKNITKENTIGLWDAVQFLKNEGKDISADLLKDLEWVKQLRNNIEHHKFEMNVHEVRRTLGRVIRATVEFNDEHGLIDLAKSIDKLCRKTFDTLADEYKASLAAAKAEANDKAGGNPTFDCTLCGERDTCAIVDQKYECFFCENAVERVRCCQCNEAFPETEVSVWNDDHQPHVDYICEGCESYIMSR